MSKESRLRKLVIIGASGHGRVIADLAKLNDYSEIVFLDDDESIRKVLDYDVVGNISKAEEYVLKGYDFAIAIGNASIRSKIQEELTCMNASLPTIIHPSAVIADDARIGSGTVVMANAVINPCCIIGKGCIINTCASLDHDNNIGDYSHISVGAHTAGTVTIGKRCWIGIGAVISNNICVCDDVVIGAGSVILRDIKKSGKYFGTPGIYKGEVECC